MATTMGSLAAARMPLAAALDLGPNVWDRVLKRSGSVNPFLTWDWHRACADALAAEELNACHAMVVRDPREDVAVLFPFRVQRDRSWGIAATELGWAFGDLGRPDHLDLLASPEADLDILVGALEAIPWAAIRLGNLTEGANQVERLCAACERRGWMVRRRTLWRCAYLDLPQSWDAYLSSLSPHGRRALRRKERKLYREHQVALTDYGGERLDEGLRHLELLHARRWGGAGVFRDPVMPRLHRRFAASLDQRGLLWLVTLDLDGTPAAAWYGFSLGDTVYHYQSGRDPRWALDRVGTVLMGLMIRRAIERGYDRLDFLRGEEAYKGEWTRTARRSYEVAVFRAGWRGAALRGLDWIELPLRGMGLRRGFDRVHRWLAQPWGSPGDVREAPGEHGSCQD